MSLPIRKVVLFKHGVAHFERVGAVTDDQAIDLHFRKSEMNDVLKSLTVLDLDGGAISSISYAASAPTERLLEDIAIRVPEGDALVGLLSQLAGAQVRVKHQGETIEGSVLGVQSQMENTATSQISKPFLTIMKGGGLKTVDLMKCEEVEFVDESLKKDVQQLLSVLFASKKKDMKKLTIFARGQGRRRVMASYIMESPVWKTSYRVLLPAETTGKTTLQGWAVVDNTQDEDWDDITLSLTAGLPISFRHDLYTPRYKRRPEIRINEEEAYAPPQLQSAVSAEAAFDAPGTVAMAAPAMAMPSMRRGGPAPPPPPDGYGGFGMAAGRQVQEMRMQQAAEVRLAREVSAPVQTRTVEVGDLFQYEIATPVTVKRNQSALVPILQTAVEAKRVAVYDRQIRDKNPMSAVLLKNTSGLTLEGGPMTVLEDESYLGEAMLDTMKTDEKRLVPFSVELGITVTQDTSSRGGSVHKVVLTNGVLRLISYRSYVNEYTITSKLKKDTELYLDHHFNKGCSLHDTQEPYERTEDNYRFKVNVVAQKSTKFTVTERSQDTQTIHINDRLDADAIALLYQRKYIDDAVSQKLGELAKLQRQIHDLEKEMGTCDRDVKELTEQNQRLRENMKALNDRDDAERQLRAQFVRGLATGEEEILALQKKRKAAQAEKESLQSALRAEIEKLSYEADL